jgi:hypothetical protein
MKKYHQQLLGILLFINILNLLTGCVTSKAFQCQKIYQIANEVTKETRSLTNSVTKIDEKTWLLAADKIEQGGEAMQKLRLSDPELQKNQAIFAQIYQDYADATREIIRAWETKDRFKAKAAQEKVRKAGQLERQVGEEINRLCY